MKRKIVSIVMASAMVFGLAHVVPAEELQQVPATAETMHQQQVKPLQKSESSDVVEGSSDDDNTLTVWTGPELQRLRDQESS